MNDQRNDPGQPCSIKQSKILPVRLTIDFFLPFAPILLSKNDHRKKAQIEGNPRSSPQSINQPLRPLPLLRLPPRSPHQNGRDRPRCALCPLMPRDSMTTRRRHMTMPGCRHGWCMTGYTTWYMTRCMTRCIMRSCIM